MIIIDFMSLFSKNKKNKIKRQLDSSDSKLPSHTVSLSDKDFQEFIDKYPISLIDFWAPWCAPCKAMSKRIRRLSSMYKSKVAFGKIDIQKNKKTAKKYDIIGIPHLIFFSNGKKISSIHGLKSVGAIKKEIEELIKKI